MYYIGICDDGQNVCQSIEEMLLQSAKEQGIQVAVNIWYSGESLKDYLAQGGQMDILYLDIELFKMTGIEVGNYIRNCLDNMGMLIIYISGKSSYAQKLFKTQPMDFLVKPISKEQIAESLETAVHILKKKNERFEFQKGKEYYYVSFGDILFLESYGRKIKMSTMSGSYEFYGKLKELMKKLPDHFLMIHQSYIVNKMYVFRYTYETVELTNGATLPISSSCRKQVRKNLLEEG